MNLHAALVYLDPTRVDVMSCDAVMGHLRGRLLATHVGMFVTAPVEYIIDAGFF